MSTAVATRSPATSVTRSLRGRLLRVAEYAVTPLVPDDYLDIFSPLRTGADLRGRIVAVEPETRDAATIVIRPGADWAGHTPGQYIRIGVDVNGVRQWRTYSLTSSLARRDGCIAVTVKAIPDGKVSNHLVRDTSPGTIIQLDQATGEFVLPETLPAKALFITAGSGITPVMGILRNQLGGPEGLSDVVLVHSAPTADDVIFRAELHDLAARGAIRLVELHTDTAGMLDVADLAEIVPDLAERATWACGPLGMLEAIESHWAGLGIEEQLFTERFRAAIQVTGEGGTVSFTTNGTSLEAEGSTPILDAAEEAGVLMPSGCRMGVCFGCVLPLREGAVRDLRNGEITTAVPGDGVKIQTCINAAAGPCTIDH